RHLILVTTVGIALQWVIMADHPLPHFLHLIYV
ncbi:MAG: hypothetical protein ACI9LX_004227, partial [Paraglaciecola sp.]